MRLLSILICLFCLLSDVRCQVPEGAVALEDMAFNRLFLKNKAPQVTGKLFNLTSDDLKSFVINYTIVTPFAQMQVHKTAYLEKDGTFKLELDYPFPYQQVWFQIGELFYTCLYANKDVYLELDIKKIKAEKEVNFNGDGVFYLGADGPLNTYMNNYVLYRRNEQLQLSNEISSLVYSRIENRDSLILKYNNLFDSLKFIEDSYKVAHPSSFSWILENERMSAYYGEICPAFWGKTMNNEFWQKIKDHKSYQLSNNSSLLNSYLAIYLSYLPGRLPYPGWKDVALLPDLNPSEKRIIDSLRQTEGMALISAPDQENIKKWIHLLKPRIDKIAYVRSIDNSIQKLDSLFNPAKADFLKLRLITSKDLNEQRIAEERILRSMHTEWCTIVTKNEYRRTVAKINEINKTLAISKPGKGHNLLGKPIVETSFGATLYKVSSVKALDFLAKLKESYKGKAIIIDRWATWCIPCLGEMPHSKELQEESKDLPVVFVYLCTMRSSSEAKWKTKVVELKQPGVHILIDETLDSELSNYFSFKGYPGYALINKEGIYKPGAIEWMSQIQNAEMLTALINK